MADIRQNPTIKDDFNRADENPLASPWLVSDTGIWLPMVLKSNSITHQLGGSSQSHWTTATFDGDAAECWATRIGGSGPFIAWGIAIWSTVGAGAVDGYRFRLENESNYTLRRFNNGVTGSLLDSDAGVIPGAIHMLIRRNGNDVEGWVSVDQNTWTLVVSATDTTYTTGFYLSLGIIDESNSQILGWDNFGGGAEANRTQIYRWIKN